MTSRRRGCDSLLADQIPCGPASGLERRFACGVARVQLPPGPSIVSSEPRAGQRAGALRGMQREAGSTPARSITSHEPDSG